jgi:hypothetical protein
MAITTDELEIRFTYHKPEPNLGGLYEMLRTEAKNFAITITESTPESREQSLAITALEEAVFWANAAIARRG